MGVALFVGIYMRIVPSKMSPPDSKMLRAYDHGRVGEEPHCSAIFSWSPCAISLSHSSAASDFRCTASRSITSD